MAVLKKKKKKLGSLRRGGSSSGSSDTSPFRPVHVDKLAPCVGNCPSGTKIREVLTTIAQTEDAGRTYDESFEKAFRIILETNPLPAVCGRVCPHPCETGCNRQYKTGEGEGPLAINNVERFLGDFALEKDLKLEKIEGEEHPEKVAIIGSGPAGLSAAYQLARRGYGVTIFEAFDKAGGMLRYGIPRYRLPAEVLDEEIERILDLGVEIKYNTMVGKDIPYEKLQEDYDAIFVGIGAHKGKLLGVPGEDAPNVWTGTLFLNKVNSGATVDVGKKVLVIGGGDTAIDAARVSRRLGAEATIVYRRTREEMPAIDEEIEGAEQEGVQFFFLAAPVEFVKDGDRVTAMKCQKMQLGEPDTSGRRRPVPIEGDFFTIDCDTCIAAISQEPEFEGLEDLREGRDWVKVDEAGKALRGGDTTYAGGDVLDLGLATIAIFQGRKAAETIHNNFRGITPEAPEEKPMVTKEQIVYSYYMEKARHEALDLPPDERLKELEKEVRKTLTEEEIIEETKRCMSCGACFDCGTCWSLCQDSVFQKPPVKTFEPYKMKMDLCKGCKKCAENCPCGFIEMRDPMTGQYADLERAQ
ncbi:MAG: NAD(P)-binding protein [Candidatus Kapaibacterium sp.]